MRKLFKHVFFAENKILCIDTLNLEKSVLRLYKLFKEAVVYLSLLAIEKWINYYATYRENQWINIMTKIFMRNFQNSFGAMISCNIDPNEEHKIEYPVKKHDSYHSSQISVNNVIVLFFLTFFLKFFIVISNIFMIRFIPFIGYNNFAVLINGNSLCHNLLIYLFCKFHL